MTRYDDEEEKVDYHGIEPIKSIFKKMKKEYDKDPKGWSVVGCKDEHGNNDTFINKKPNMYWLKSKALSPYSALSMGTVIRNIDRDIDERIGKTLTKDDMLRLFGMIVPINKDQNVVAAGVEKYSQNHANYIKKIISERDSNIPQVIRRKIDEEFIKRFPQRDGLYI
ncbi:MAG: hypothetical protein ACTSYC_12040 [Promethearchaeota archaeon]